METVVKRVWSGVNRYGDDINLGTLYSTSIKMWVTVEPRLLEYVFHVKLCLCDSFGSRSIWIIHDGCLEALRLVFDRANPDSRVMLTSFAASSCAPVRRRSSDETNIPRSAPRSAPKTAPTTARRRRLSEDLHNKEG